MLPWHPPMPPAVEQTDRARGPGECGLLLSRAHVCSDDTPPAAPHLMRATSWWRGVELLEAVGLCNSIDSLLGGAGQLDGEHHCLLAAGSLQGTGFMGIVGESLIPFLPYISAVLVLPWTDLPEPEPTGFIVWFSAH